MFSHCLIGSNELERSRKFYDPIMAVLGYTNEFPPEMERLKYSNPAGGAFLVSKPRNGEPATGNGWIIGFAAPDDATVNT